MKQYQVVVVETGELPIDCVVDIYCGFSLKEARKKVDEIVCHLKDEYNLSGDNIVSADDKSILLDVDYEYHKILITILDCNEKKARLSI
jgi:hypothetical protein